MGFQAFRSVLPLVSLVPAPARRHRSRVQASIDNEVLRRRAATAVARRVVTEAEMRKTLVMVGGFVNVLFFFFHIYLGWQLHHLAVAAGLRGLLETFNLGGTLMIAFFALVSLAYPREVLTTGVGRSTMGLVIGVYVSRAVAEVVLFPQPRPLILFVCLATVAIYALAALLPDPLGAEPATAEAVGAAESRAPGHDPADAPAGPS